MKTRFQPSIAVLVASLAAPGAVMALPSMQDDGGAGGTGGLNAPIALDSTAPVQASPDTANGSPAATGLQDSGGPGQGRKPIVGDDKLVALQFRDQKIDVLIDTISQWTGKSVIPKQTAITPIKVTIISDRMMPKGEALNLIFQALRLNGLGVVETDDMILIDNLTEINQLQPAKVLGPDVDVMPLPEIGSIVIKVFRIKNTKASQVYERLQDSLPSLRHAAGGQQQQPDHPRGRHCAGQAAAAHD